MKQKIFLLLLLFPVISHAQDSKISFSLGNKIYNSTEEINLTFVLNSCSKEFRVRPNVDVGTIEIHNPKTLSWVPQNNSWDNFPYMAEKMKIRITGVVDKKVSIGIELQNVKLGSVEKSKDTKVWISDAYKNYINILNADVLQTSQSADGKIQQ